MPAAMQKTAVLEFPGVLADRRDLSGVVAALGGAPAVVAAVRTDRPAPRAGDVAPTLRLHLRPGELSSRSNIGSASAAPLSMFVLRITAPCEGGGGASSARRLLEGRIESQVEKRVVFPGMADFQLFSREALEGAAVGEEGLWGFGTEGATAAGVVADVSGGEDGRALEELQWREKAALDVLRDMAWRVSKEVREDHVKPQTPEVREETERWQWLSEMRPTRFARAWVEEGATDAWFRDFGIGMPTELEAIVLRKARDESGGLEKIPSGWRLLSADTAPNDGGGVPLIDVDKRQLPTRLSSLPYRVEFNCEKVPQESPFEIPDLDAVKATLAWLRPKFAERPVWSRRALLLNSDASHVRQFKAAIRHVAYSFSSLKGPFSQMWVRYGYDPRTSALANRKYQTIEVRVLSDSYAAAVEKKYGPSASIDELHIVGNCTLEDLPSNKILQLHLFELKVPGVDEILAKPQYNLSVFDPLTGFLTDHCLKVLVELLRTRITDQMIEVLGRSEYYRINNHQEAKRKHVRNSRISRAWPYAKPALSPAESSSESVPASPDAGMIDVGDGSDGDGSDDVGDGNDDVGDGDGDVGDGNDDVGDGDGDVGDGKDNDNLEAMRRTAEAAAAGEFDYKAAVAGVAEGVREPSLGETQVEGGRDYLSEPLAVTDAITPNSIRHEINGTLDAQGGEIEIGDGTGDTGLERFGGSDGSVEGIEIYGGDDDDDSGDSGDDEVGTSDSEVD